MIKYKGQLRNKIKLICLLEWSLLILTTFSCNAASATSAVNVKVVTPKEKEIMTADDENGIMSVLLTTTPLESTSNFLLESANADKSIPKVKINPKLDEIDEKYSTCKGIEIREITIPQIQILFTSGQLTSVDLVKCYLARIDRMNNVLKVVMQLNPDAIKEAFELDKERQSGGSRGPMHGIPVLLKEGIGTEGDKMETTAGSPALVGIHPKKDADVVTALRKAGAVILGKSNLSEFYWVRGNNVPNGWSGRGGQTRNAYNLNETPEGSSSGSAVGVSANLCSVSVATETDGSTIVPSSLNGICAMKPTFGLFSMKGVIPLSLNQDNIGSMGRTVTDVAILLDGMILPNERPSHHPPSYYQYLTTTNQSRLLRIGVMRYPYWNTSVINSTHLPQQLPHLEKMVQNVKRSPIFEVIDPVDATSKELFGNISVANEYIMILHDLKHGINEYLKTEVVYPAPSETAITRNMITSLNDIIQYNEEHPFPEGYNQEILKSAEATDGLQNKTYIDARDTNRANAKQFLDSIMEKYNLDAVVTPSDSRTVGVLEKSLEDFPPFGFSMACFAGYPSIQIPIGIGQDNVPFGVTFVGKPHTEPVLLKVAHAVEQLDPQRRPPRFLI